MAALVEPKRRPIEQAQTQIDSAAVERVDVASDVHIQPQVLLGIELSSTANQHRGQVAPYVPIAPLVGIGQRRATHRLTKSHPIELGWIGTKCCLDIAQRFSPGELRVGHDAKVFGARQDHGTRVARVLRHDAREARPRYKLHELRKQRLACVQSNLPKLST